MHVSELACTTQEPWTWHTWITPVPFLQNICIKCRICMGWISYHDIFSQIYWNFLRTNSHTLPALRKQRASRRPIASSVIYDDARNVAFLITVVLTVWAPVYQVYLLFLGVCFRTAVHIYTKKVTTIPVCSSDLNNSVSLNVLSCHFFFHWEQCSLFQELPDHIYTVTQSHLEAVQYNQSEPLSSSTGVVGVKGLAHGHLGGGTEGGESAAFHFILLVQGLNWRIYGHKLAPPTFRPPLPMIVISVVIKQACLCHRCTLYLNIKNT